jgi:hypothetical protein
MKKRLLVENEMGAAHDNDWTVAALKQHFEALRKEDEKAIQLVRNDMLAMRIDIANKLDQLTNNSNILRTTVEQFHSAFTGEEKRGMKDYMSVINFITILTMIGLLIVNFFHH